MLEERGERGIASTVAALRAHALVELGRVEETERLAEIALQWADEDDVVSHAYARGALARCQAADGRARQALESAHNAVKLLSTGDFLNAHGDALFDRAIVLTAVGDREGARGAPAAEALALYRAKGNVATAKRVALLLD